MRSWDGRPGRGRGPAFRPLVVEQTTPAAPLVWTIDATSNKATPANLAEMNSLLTSAGIAGASVEALYLFGAPASGNVADSSGNSKTLTAAGTLAYQQTVTGWTARSIRTTAGSAGHLSNATFGNANASDCTVILYALVASASTFRALMHIGGDFDASVCFELNSSPALLLGRGNGAGRQAGAFDPTGSVRPFVLTSDAGVSANGYTNQEEIVPGSPANGASGTELKFGGDGTDSWQPAGTDYVWGCRLSKALSSVEVAALLASAGW